MAKTSNSKTSTPATINADQITVKSMETFASDNIEYNNQATEAIVYAGTVSIGTENVNNTLEEIKTNLKKLKKVKLSKIEKLTDKATYTEKYSKNLLSNTSYALTKSVLGFKYAELLFKKYDQGNLTAEEEEELGTFESFFQTFNDTNGFWITSSVAELLAECFPALGALVILTKGMAYTGDASEGSDFIVGDSFKTFGEKLLEKAAGSPSTDLVEKSVFKSALNNFLKYGSGTAAVAIFEFTLGNIIRYENDEGDWTALDEERMYLSAGKGVLSYVTWNATTDICVACGMSTGGAGLVAAGVAIYCSLLFDSIKDYITGDEIVEYTKVGENLYPIPANGNGENGTYDVILEKARDQFKRSTTEAPIEDTCDPTEPPTSESTQPTTNTPATTEPSEIPESTVQKVIFLNID